MVQYPRAAGHRAYRTHLAQVPWHMLVAWPCTYTEAWTELHIFQAAGGPTYCQSRPSTATVSHSCPFAGTQTHVCTPESVDTHGEERWGGDLTVPGSPRNILHPGTWSQPLFSSEWGCLQVSGSSTCCVLLGTPPTPGFSGWLALFGAPQSLGSTALVAIS